MTRNEHLEWCKERALEYVECGDLHNALRSMYSDLGKHPKTEKHSAIELGVAMQMMGNLSTKDEVAKFIEGCN